MVGGRIRVLIAEDQQLIRQAVGALLVGDLIEIVGEAGDGLVAVDMAGVIQPDVVLMDIAMPKLDGIEATRRIKRLAPKVRVLMLTSTVSERQAADAVAAGADGYALKLLGRDELMAAMARVRAGTTYLAPGLDAAKVREMVEEQSFERPVALTAREREVVRLIAQGMSNREIADALNVAFKTADAHRTNAMQKLGVHNSAELATYAIRLGLIE